MIGSQWVKHEIFDFLRIPYMIKRSKLDSNDR